MISSVHINSTTMKTNTMKNLSFGAVAALSLACGNAVMAASYTLALGSNMDNANGWLDDIDGVTTGEPTGSADTGLIDGNGNYNSSNWVTEADIVMNSGAINGAGGSQNFNFSSSTGNGSFTMNGGTFNSRGILANRNDISLLGGTWTVGNLTSGSSVGAGNTGTLTIGGSFVLLNSRTTAHAYSSSGGDIVFQTDWTGSWENDTVDLAAWKAELTTGNYFLGTTAIDSTVFDDNFQVTGNTLSLVPEPSSAALLGLGGLALILRRRK